nr:toprim domain-containing protein [Methylobacterium sp. L1A1]
MTELRAIAQALGGEVAAGQVLAPAPGHSSRDRSMSIRLNPRAPGGLLVHLFSGGDALAAKDHVLDLLGWPRADEARGRDRPQPARRPEPETPPIEADEGASERTARALAIFRETEAPWGSPVEAYLARERGLEPFEALARTVRFHPACPFAGGFRTPAMVALVRDVRTNVPKAIHRTALTLDGRKAVVGGNDRLSLGPVSGGAIKLTPDEDVTLALGIGEGIESALSLRRLPEFAGSPVWSLISANGIERLPVLAGIESLWIAVDHDEAGLRASQACADRWTDAGAETFLVTPETERTDLNDAFKRRHHG